MIVFSKEEADKLDLKYRKSCFICNREFWTGSRNCRYCSPECVEKGQVKNVARNKTRRRRRKQYDANKEINRILSRSYALAHEVMKLYKVPQKCCCLEFGLTDECSGALELHHLNGDPLENSPFNLKWACRHHHAKLDDMHPEVNMVDTFNEAVDAAGFEEEENKYKVMIDYTKRKIEGTL